MREGGRLDGTLAHEDVKIEDTMTQPQKHLSRPAFHDAALKTPQRLALTIARISVAAAANCNSDLSPAQMAQIQAGACYHDILHQAHLTNELIPSDADGDIQIIWGCPEIKAALQTIAEASPSDLSALAAACLENDPSLDHASFLSLDGRITKDLTGVLARWAAEASQQLGEDIPAQSLHLSLADTVLADSFASGAETLAELHARIANAASDIGEIFPERLGTFLLRAGQMLDEDTWKLGVPEDCHRIAGVPYALFLAYLADSAGIRPPEPGQTPIGHTIRLTALNGVADAYASGAPKLGECSGGGEPLFGMLPDAVTLAIAGHLARICATEGRFATLVAAVECSRSLMLDEPAGMDEAFTSAITEFCSTTRHAEPVVREVLCSLLWRVIPEEIFLNPDPKAFQATGDSNALEAQLTQALHTRFPKADPIRCVKFLRVIQSRLTTS